jgi:hypothetical protein
MRRTYCRNSIWDTGPTRENTAQANGDELSFEIELYATYPMVRSSVHIVISSDSPQMIPKRARNTTKKYDP